MKLFAILVCAHILGDFVLQPDFFAKNKHRLMILALHSVIHAALAWLLLGQWALWQLPLFVLLGHFMIDILKRRARDTASIFVLDQFLHLAFLTGLVCFFRGTGAWIDSGVPYRILVTACGFIAVVRGSGFLVAKVTRRLLDQSPIEVNGLEGGGQLIGQLERGLIFLLMLIGQPAGIGFLVAAKSILRFEEAKDQKVAEYVLIGTLLSFTLAIAISALTLQALML